MPIFYIPPETESDSTILVGDVNGSVTSNYISDRTITGKLITGFSNLNGTVTSNDSILSALGKINYRTIAVLANSVDAYASTLSIGSANTTQTINLGGAAVAQTINVGKSGAGVTTINLGGWPGDLINVAGALTATNSSGLATFKNDTTGFVGVGDGSSIAAGAAGPMNTLDVFGSATFGTGTSKPYRIADATAVINAFSPQAGSGNLVRLIREGVGKLDINYNNSSGKWIEFVDKDNSSVVPLSLAMDGTAVALVPTLKSNSIESISTTLNIATANNTQTVNLGSGTGVQTINLGNSGAGATTINVGGATDLVNIAGALTTTGNLTVNNTLTTTASAGLVLTHPGGYGTFGPAVLTLANANQRNGLQLDTTGSSVAIADMVFRTSASSALNYRYENRSGYYANTANSTFGESQFLVNSGNTMIAYFGSAAAGVSGSLTATSLISTGSVTAPSLTFPSGTLSYYEEYTHNTTFSGPATVGSYALHIVQVGKKVTLYFSDGPRATTVTAGQSMWIMQTALPARFRPVSGINTVLMGVNNNLVTIMNAVLSNLGDMVISMPSAPGVTYTGTVGWNAFSLSWTL